MNKQTAIDILENLDLSNISDDVAFWWEDPQEAIKTLLSIVDDLEESLALVESDLEIANDDLYDAKEEIKDLQEEIKDLNKTIEDKDDEISRLEDLIYELGERGDAA